MPTLHKKITSAMLTHSPWTTLHRKIICNVVLIYVGQHCARKLPVQCWPMVNRQLFHSKITYRMLCLSRWEYCLANVVKYVWDNIAQENYLRKRKLLVQCWLRTYRYTFSGKPAVSNMSGGLFINQVQHHRTILALFTQCWLRSSRDNNGQGPALTGISIRI